MYTWINESKWKCNNSWKKNPLCNKEYRQSVLIDMHGSIKMNRLKFYDLIDIELSFLTMLTCLYRVIFPNISCSSLLASCCSALTRKSHNISILEN